MTTRRRPRVQPTTADDVAFDDALAHISLLAARLQQVRALHRPRPTLLRGRRCADCGRPYPCPTLTCITNSYNQTSDDAGLRMRSAS